MCKRLQKRRPKDSRDSSTLRTLKFGLLRVNSGKFAVSGLIFASSLLDPDSFLVQVSRKCPEGLYGALESLSGFD